MLKCVVDAIVSSGGSARAIPMYVADAASIEQGLQAADVFDILVNNAGIVREARVFGITHSDWDAVLDTNLKGMFLVTPGAARRMRESGGGSIINIASILGLRQGGGVLPLCRVEGGGHPTHQSHGLGTRSVWNTGECHRASAIWQQSLTMTSGRPTRARP